MSSSPAFILYVDDEPTLLEIGKLFLERSGECRVEIRESADTALETLQESHFDAIISDYQMPGMNGLEFLRIIRDTPDLKDIPFILFTGKGREEVVIAAIDSGADFYLQKGGDPEAQFAELHHKIYQAIRRRQSERAFIENQSLLSLAETVTSSGSWTFDIKSGKGIFSDGFFRVIGIPRIEEQGILFFYSIIHPQDRKRVKNAYREFIEGERDTSEDEYRIIHPDGSIRFIHTIRKLTRGADGVTQVFGTLQDITERKAEQYELKHSNELYQSFIQASPDVIIIADTAGTIIFASPRIHETFGIHSGQEVVGENITTWIHPEDRHLAYSCILKHIQGETAPPIIYRLIKQNSEVFTAEIHSAPLHDSEGNVYGFVALIRDNTERVAQHEALQRANMKLNLLSSITRHDILNKITALRLYCSLIGDEEDPAMNRSMLEKVEEMAEIISNLVSFTSYYQNLGINTAQWISPGDVFDKILEMIDADEIKVVNDFGSVKIVADPLFEKVLYNLLDNANKYAKKATTIHSGYKLAGETLILTIEDDGIGIHPDLKEKIFERNFGHGTGLGLFLSREILSVTDLTIRETGTHGIGARFEITVPAGKYLIPD